LTLYIVNVGKQFSEPSKLASLSKTIGSFGKTVNEVICLEGSNWEGIVETKNDWFMIMYPEEYLDENLCEVLPTYLATDYDCFIFMRIKDTDKEGTSTPQVFQEPRLFRKSVKLQKGSLIPIDFEKIKFTRVLDGWLIGE
jgi:hypothetical protein